MARVAVFVPDLLFGSNVLGALRAAGHEAALCGDETALLREAPGCEVVVVDLTAAIGERVAALESLRAAGLLGGARILAFYSHVDVEARDRARSIADLAVPRSRMAREGPALVAALAGG